MIARLLATLGLHVDQQSLSNLWMKALGIASLVAGGTLNVAWALQSGFGLSISMAANDRIKFWCVAIGVIVTYFTSKNTDQRFTPPSSAPSTRLPMALLVVGLGGSLSLMAACASTPIQKVTIGETAAVQAVHAVVAAEANAYKAGAYDQATHDKYLLALKNVIQGEKALNDAVIAWAHVDGQPVPAAVATAVKALAGVLKDVQPLIPTNSTAATLASAIVGAIGQLTGA